jgi:hypothetical protein
VLPTNRFVERCSRSCPRIAPSPQQQQQQQQQQ